MVCPQVVVYVTVRETSAPAAVLPAYSSVENHLELGVLDGLTEIRSFLRQL